MRPSYSPPFPSIFQPSAFGDKEKVIEAVERIKKKWGVITSYSIHYTKLYDLRRDDLEALFPGVLDAVIAAADAERETAA